MIVQWFTIPGPTLKWFGQTEGTLALILHGGMSAVASVIGPEGPEGPSGASIITIDPAPDNIITTGPDGLYATPIWQTTDW